MVEEQVQAQAANTLLERGVRFSIPAPFLLRIFGKKKVSLVIRQPKLGTLIYMSKGFVSMNVDPSLIESGDVDQAYMMVAKHGDEMSRLMAVAVLNGKLKIKLLSVIVGKWLKWKLTAVTLAELFFTVTTLSGVQHFTTTIRYLPAMNLMKRRNLSPEIKGSQEAESKVFIAPGEQSGA